MKMQQYLPCMKLVLCITMDEKDFWIASQEKHAWSLSECIQTMSGGLFKIIYFYSKIKYEMEFIIPLSECDFVAKAECSKTTGH